MKILVTYSSKTGNTELVAQAISRALGDEASCLRMDENIDIANYDWIILGFWIDKGRPNKEALKFIKNIKGKKVSFFYTLGADAESDHAKKCTANSIELLKDNEIKGHFCCQGKIDPALIKFLSRFPVWFPHGPNPERIARWESASTHPNEEDLNNATKYFAEQYNSFLR